MSLIVFCTSVSSSAKIKREQQHIISVLESKKIPFKSVDISQDSQNRDLMRKIAGNPTALPPQIAKEDVYCGDYDAFKQAIEMEELEAFLKL